MNVLIVKDIFINGIYNDYMFVKKKGIFKIVLYLFKYIIINNYVMYINYILYVFFF